MSAGKLVVMELQPDQMTISIINYLFIKTKEHTFKFKLALQFLYLQTIREFRDTGMQDFKQKIA
jgi:hypothetical protein